MDITQIEAEQINAANLTVQVLNASEFEYLAQYKQQFPNIERLIAKNITAKTAYPKEI